MEQQNSFETNKKLYNFKPTALLTFDNFYQNIKIQKQKENQYIEFGTFSQRNSNFDEFLGVKIEDKIRIFKWIKLQEQNNCKSTELLLENQFANQIFQLVKKQIFSKQNVFNNFGDKSQLFTEQQMFQIQTKNCPDMLVSDIYGPNSSSIGLPPNLIASCLGKLSNTSTSEFNKNQLLRSLSMSLAINSAQITALVSLKYKIQNIIILKNDLGSKNFNRVFYTLLSLYNSNSKAYFFQN